MFITLTFSNFIRWMEEHMLSCPSKKYLHIECPGCGFQRSFIALMQGDLYTSLALYPATIPILIMIVFTMFHLKYKFLYGAAIIKYLQISTAIVILVFYIYKVIHLKIIT
jgi:hypothetical protein